MQVLVVICGLTALCLTGCGTKQAQSQKQAVVPQNQGKSPATEIIKKVEGSEPRRVKLDANAKVPEAEALPTEEKSAGDHFLETWEMPKYPGLQALTGTPPYDYGFAISPDKGSVEQIAQFYLHKFATIGCELDEQQSYVTSRNGVILKCKHPKGKTTPVIFTVVISQPESVLDPKEQDGRIHILMMVGQR